MPSSTWVHTSTICDLLWKYKPKSLLDIGVGFGRWGFIAREMLDIFRGRYNKDDWKTEIIGVEINQPYIQEHHRWLYNETHCPMDAEYFLHITQRRFDVVIMGDIVEHFLKNKALDLIQSAYSVCDKAVIICIPIGEGYKQGETLGNVYEAHLSTWTEEELKKLPNVSRVTTVRERIKQRPYGIVLMEKH